VDSVRGRSDEGKLTLIGMIQKARDIIMFVASRKERAVRDVYPLALSALETTSSPGDNADTIRCSERIIDELISTGVCRRLIFLAVCLELLYVVQRIQGEMT